MIENRQELYNYMVTVLKELYKEIDSTPFNKEGEEVLKFYEELSAKTDRLILKYGDKVRLCPSTTGEIVGFDPANKNRYRVLLDNGVYQWYLITDIEKAKGDVE